VFRLWIPRDLALDRGFVVVGDPKATIVKESNSPPPQTVFEVSPAVAATIHEIANQEGVPPEAIITMAIESFRIRHQS
jgi:hypothetical protein